MFNTEALGEGEETFNNPVALKIRGKNLTEEEKKEVYRSAFKDTRKKLMEVFTNEQVKKIIKLEKESFQK